MAAPTVATDDKASFLMHTIDASQLGWKPAPTARGTRGFWMGSLLPGRDEPYVARLPARQTDACITEVRDKYEPQPPPTGFGKPVINAYLVLASESYTSGEYSPEDFPFMLDIIAAFGDEDTKITAIPYKMLVRTIRKHEGELFHPICELSERLEELAIDMREVLAAESLLVLNARIGRYDRTDYYMRDFPGPGQKTAAVVSACSPRLLWKLVCACVYACEKRTLAKAWRRVSHVADADPNTKLCTQLLLLPVEELSARLGACAADIDLLTGAAEGDPFAVRCAKLARAIAFVVLRTRKPGFGTLVLTLLREAEAFANSDWRAALSSPEVKQVLCGVVLAAMDGLYAGTWYMYDGVGRITLDSVKKDTERAKADRISRYRRWHGFCELAMAIAGDAMPDRIVVSTHLDVEWRVRQSRGDHDTVLLPEAVSTGRRLRNEGGASPSRSAVEFAARAVPTLRLALCASYIHHWPFRAMMQLPATHWTAETLFETCMRLVHCHVDSKGGDYGEEAEENWSSMLDLATRREFLVLAYKKLVELSWAGGAQAGAAVDAVVDFWERLPYEFMRNASRPMPPRSAAEREESGGRSFKEGLGNGYVLLKDPTALGDVQISSDDEDDDEPRFCAERRQKRRRINGAHQSGRFFKRVAHKTYPSYWRAGVDVDPSGTSFAATRHALRGRNFHPAVDGAKGAAEHLEDLVVALLGEMPDTPEETARVGATVCDALRGMSWSLRDIFATALDLPKSAKPQAEANRHLYKHLGNVLEVYTRQIKRAVSADPRYFRVVRCLVGSQFGFVHGLVDVKDVFELSWADSPLPVATVLAAVDLCNEAAEYLLDPARLRDPDYRPSGWERVGATQAFWGFEKAAADRAPHPPTVARWRAQLVFILFNSLNAVDDRRSTWNADLVEWMHGRFAHASGWEDVEVSFEAEWHLGPELALKERREWYDAQLLNNPAATVESALPWNEAEFEAEFVRNREAMPLQAALEARYLVRDGSGCVPSQCVQSRAMLAAFDAETERFLTQLLGLFEWPRECLHWTLVVAASLQWTAVVGVLVRPFRTRNTNYDAGIRSTAVEDWMLNLVQHDVDVGPLAELGADRVRAGFNRPCTVEGILDYLCRACETAWAPSSEVVTAYAASRPATWAALGA